VTVIGRSSSRARLDIARKLGFSVLISNEEDADHTILDTARGLGVDLALETTASASGLELAVTATRRLGRIVCLGISGRASVPFAVDAAMERSVTVHFSMSSEYSAWARSLQLMASGRYDPSPLVTTYGLEMWSRAFDDVAKHRVVKAALTPRSTVSTATNFSWKG
jgi:threonine dehydrogenase-like Zn-dependent dehydrogenase